MRSELTTNGHAPESPLVTVAIPVFNGESFLAQAIESVLEQTYTNVELVICDNASTDGTQDICERFRQLDDRIRYHRNAENIGAARNFNLAFSLAKGSYFKWLAADEFIEPTFVEVTLGLLAEDHDAVLACTNYIGHYEYDGSVHDRDFELELSEAKGSDRFRTLMNRERGRVLPIWGLMRTDLLAKTSLIQSFIRSDHNLIAELALLGKFAQSPLRLAHLRTHEHAYHRMSDRTGGIEGPAEASWFDPSNSSRLYFPHWRRLFEHAKAVARSKSVSGVEKATLTRYLIFPFGARWAKLLARDVVVAFGGAPLYRRLQTIRASRRRA